MPSTTPQREVVVPTAPIDYLLLALGVCWYAVFGSVASVSYLSWGFPSDRGEVDTDGIWTCSCRDGGLDLY